MDLDLSHDSASLTASLVDIRSVSGEEEPLASLIEAALRGLPHLSVHRDGNAVIARTTLGRPQRVIVAGHIDTVPVAGNLPSHAGGGPALRLRQLRHEVGGGGRAAARRPADPAVPRRDLGVLRLRRGRGGTQRPAPAVPQLPAVCWRATWRCSWSPPAASIEGGCQGTLRAEVVTHGKRAHSARAWMGQNAIHAAAGILELLRGYEPRKPDVDGLTYREGLNAVGIRGGVAGNVVPDECVVTVNFRFAPDRSAEQAAAHVREVFAGLRRRDHRLGAGCPPGLGHPAAATLLAAVGGVPRAKLGWTDVARFAALGLPAVNYGPGDPELAHAPDEHVDVAQIAECEAKMAAWLSYLRSPASLRLLDRPRGQRERAGVLLPAGLHPGDRDGVPRVVVAR